MKKILSILLIALALNATGTNIIDISANKAYIKYAKKRNRKIYRRQNWKKYKIRNAVLITIVSFIPLGITIKRNIQD